MQEVRTIHDSNTANSSDVATPENRRPSISNQKLLQSFVRQARMYMTAYAIDMNFRPHLSARDAVTVPNSMLHTDVAARCTTARSELLYPQQH